MPKPMIIKSLLKMRDIVAPEPDLYGIAPLAEANMPNKLTNILRVFKPIDNDKGRKAIGAEFNRYEDALSDSPITIGHKMQQDWDNFKYHIIVQSSLCNFRCHYCYVDFKYLGKIMIHVTAEEILNQFLAEREKARTQGLNYNVLRISGGEPMLVPDLTLYCLRRLKELKLDKEICIKTETNLSPLAKMDNGQPMAALWADLAEMASYQNFLVHPTIHGISANNLRENANTPLAMFDMVCEGLATLVEYGIDFYPSFGANTVELADVEPFFERLVAIHKNLPLRVAARPFKFDYNAVTNRHNDDIINQVNQQRMVLDKWDELLKRQYAVGYAETPRYQVSLN
jgi:sulfatase maturation enzyme AslB (radical SAM superfamily)